MTTKIHNSDGQGRKQLSDQLDRLDGIIDGLSDGLNEAVASAVEAAVGQAVEKAIQGVLTELISNPAVRDLLRNAPAPPPAPEASPKDKDKPATALDRACDQVRAAGRACAAGLKRSWQVVLLAGAGVAAGAAWLGRSRLAVAATALCGWAVGVATVAGGFLGRLLPVFALSSI